MAKKKEREISIDIDLVLSKRNRLYPDLIQWDQKTLSDKVGVTECTITKYKHGKIPPIIEKLVDMATFANCTIDELIKVEYK